MKILNVHYNFAVQQKESNDFGFNHPNPFFDVYYSIEMFETDLGHDNDVFECDNQ